VNTPNGVVSYPAPAAIFVGEPRHYGAVPAIGEHPASTQTPSVRTKAS
jgi:itaconate CoA-transferase